MDFFASDAFLTALARDYYRAKKVDVKTYELPGMQVRLAVVNESKVLTTGPFYDYVKAFPVNGKAQAGVGYIPKLVTSRIALEDENPAAAVPLTGQEPAPFVLWERFATWEEYLALVRKRSKNLLPARRRKLRRTTEAFGAPAFTFDNPDVKALNLCVEWKIEQYEGGHETLEDPNALAMLEGLFKDGHLILSTLEVSGSYVAVHAGFLWQGEYMDLLSAYDPAFAQYGVGREILVRMLEYSYNQGHTSFSFLQGGESYKWDYATHVYLIESYGQPPLAHRTSKALERIVRQQLFALSPRLFYGVKRLVLTGRKEAAIVRNRFFKQERKDRPGA